MFNFDPPPALVEWSPMFDRIIEKVYLDYLAKYPLPFGTSVLLNEKDIPPAVPFGPCPVCGDRCLLIDTKKPREV